MPEMAASLKHRAPPSDLRQQAAPLRRRGRVARLAATGQPQEQISAVLVVVVVAAVRAAPAATAAMAAMETTPVRVPLELSAAVRLQTRVRVVVVAAVAALARRLAATAATAAQVEAVTSFFGVLLLQPRTSN